MFDPHTHPFVGTKRLYAPKGTSPEQIKIAQALPVDPKTVLTIGDTVTVESAWTRPYMARTASVLFYVRSLRTGMSTHVVEDDINLELSA